MKTLINDVFHAIFHAQKVGAMLGRVLAPGAPTHPDWVQPADAPDFEDVAGEDRHGAGDRLLYEYDSAEQLRFEAECARELAGKADE